MIEFKLFGKVLPLHREFTMRFGQALQWSDGDRSITFVPKIDAGIIEIDCLAEKMDKEVVGPLVMQEPSTLIALNDAIMALSQPFYVPIGCGRAVDGIRQAFVTADNTRNQQWTAMQAALRLTPEYQRHVSEAAAKPRHAEARSFTPDEIKEILKRTWTIINRYLEYRKRGNQLTETEFPLL